jgi:hypothetical protein
MASRQLLERLAVVRAPAAAPGLQSVAVTIGSNCRTARHFARAYLPTLAYAGSPAVATSVRPGDGYSSRVVATFADGTVQTWSAQGGAAGAANFFAKLTGGAAAPAPALGARGSGSKRRRGAAEGDEAAAAAAPDA